jgi:hypothetical protein|tara:strand:+ start:290 stop:424 length:135 start_codon:yes stop_codon:yes gene_type:complete
MADLCAMKINFQNRAENFEARFEGKPEFYFVRKHLGFIQIRVLQ